ncbi:ABC transporter permease [Pseudomonas sp. PDM16]|uniref:ABC transporter permease n=1 Tax=Pseudomonas sp. PDM16 TaxID=2769292 RepID=UPI001783C786|nr:ABC transporter permease [Pseudomonas sp. PDM16]MBD9413487.1 ABC transporter permease [Pseudomonas sp. PDM16]
MVGDIAPLIELRGIRRRYGGEGGAPEVEVLRGIDLSIDAGEFVAIVGSSGSGKSTLMNLLGCLDRPSAGSYHFAGRDVAGLDADQLAWLRREAFGFVFQGYHLIATESARENVEVPALYAGMPAHLRRERADALLARLGLGERLDHRPGQLSGGQQQRVSIARALMNGGRIILADEPTGALDSSSGQEVMALLRELAAAGHTVILITHDREVAAQAQRVIEIRDGSIIGDSGAPFDARKSNPAALPAPRFEDMSEHAGGWSAAGEVLRSAWRVMLLNRFRTALTLLGIVIGVASVIVMLAIGLGTKQRVMAQMASMGATTLYLYAAQPPEGGPWGELSLGDMEAIERLPEVDLLTPVIGNPLMVQYGNAAREIYVYSSNEQLPGIHHWPLASGRFFTAGEDRELAPVVVLGHKARQFFFRDEANPLGKQLLIGDAPFEVIGVMAEKGKESGADYYDEMVFIPYDAGRARVYQDILEPEYATFTARTTAQVQAAEDAVTELLLARHGREDFQVDNAAAKVQAEAETQDSMTRMLGLIAAVSLLVGGIGVMNVMLMTVRERTREIGVRMATGARQRDILRQFLGEAVLVTIVGGSAGVLIGLVTGTGLLLAGVPLIFSLSAMLLAFACAVGTGLLFGYLPAKTAAALDPVAALASE